MPTLREARESSAASDGFRLGPGGHMPQFSASHPTFVAKCELLHPEC